MCYSVYIATNVELKLGKFVPEKTDIYFEKPSGENEIALREKFSKKNIYYVGSDTSCSCGLDFNSEKFDDPESKDNIVSPQKFIEAITDLTKSDDLEFYCCWSGDEESDFEDRIEIDIKEISLDKNYFGLQERQFILFKRQP